MANCSNCGAYISSGSICTDCDNNTYLAKSFTSYADSLNKRAVDNLRRSSSYDDDDDDSDSSSSYSSGSYAYEDQRNGFVSFLFGLVIGIGIYATFILVYHKLGLDNIYIISIGSMMVFLAAVITTLVAWRNRKNILFFIMLALAIPGIYSFVNEIIQSKSGLKMEQSSASNADDLNNK